MEIKTEDYDAVNAVYVFRDEFSESLADTRSQIYWEIVGDPLSADEDDQIRPDRLLDLYIEIQIEAEIEHQETGKNFDDCLDGLLSKAHHKSAETSLSAAWASILKAQFHYYNGQMHLALRELIRANFCFGVYIGNYNFSFQYKNVQSNSGYTHWYEGSKENIKILKYYLDNIGEFKSKKDAVGKIEKSGITRLKFDQIEYRLKGNVIEKLEKLEKKIQTFENNHNQSNDF